MNTLALNAEEGGAAECKVSPIKVILGMKSPVVVECKASPKVTGIKSPRLLHRNQRRMTAYLQKIFGPSYRPQNFKDNVWTDTTTVTVTDEHEEGVVSLLDLECKFVPTALPGIPKTLSTASADSQRGTTSISVKGMKSQSTQRRERLRMQAYLQKIHRQTVCASDAPSNTPVAVPAASLQVPDLSGTPDITSTNTPCDPEGTPTPLNSKIASRNVGMHPSVAKRGRSDSKDGQSLGRQMTKMSPAWGRQPSDSTPLRSPKHERGRSNSTTDSVRSPEQERRRSDSTAISPRHERACSNRSPGQERMAFENIVMTSPPSVTVSQSVPPKINASSPKMTNGSSSLASHNQPLHHQLEKQLVEQKKINGILCNGNSTKDDEIHMLKETLKNQEIALNATAHLLTQVRDDKAKECNLLTKKYEILAEQKRNIIKENKEYHSQITKEHQLEISKLKKQIEKEKAAKKILGERIVELNDENRDLKKEVDAANGEVIAVGDQLKKVRGQRDAVEAEKAQLVDQRDKAVADMDQIQQLKLGREKLAEEIANVNGKLKEVRNTRQRDSRAYKTENDNLKQILTDLKAVVAHKDSSIVSLMSDTEEMKRSIKQKDDSIQILITEMGKRPDVNIILKVQFLQKLSSTIWEMNHSYLKIFKKMGVAKNLNLMDVFIEMRATVQRTASPDFITSKIDDVDVPNDLDIRLRKTKEMLNNFWCFFKAGRKELSHSAAVKRRHPSDGTSSMSDASDWSNRSPEYDVPAKMVKSESL